MTTRSHRRAWLPSSTLLASALFAVAAPALAQDATWLLNPSSGDWDTAANWSPATVPTGTATFGASTTTSLTFPALYLFSVGTIQLNADAPAYLFNLSGGSSLRLTGVGIANNSGNAPTFVVDGFSGLGFRNSSTASNAAISNLGVTEFRDSSTAANATISNDGSRISFFDTATAGNATITNGNAQVQFFNSSTAASATVTNTGAMSFFDTSTAANATITNDNFGHALFIGTSTAADATISNSNGGSTQFDESATAGNATITTSNGGGVSFTGSSTAGNATITNTTDGGVDFFDSSTAGNATIINDGGFTFFAGASTGGGATIISNGVHSLVPLSIVFFENSTGGQARFITNAGGVVDFSNTTGPAGDGQITAGSIEGAGTYLLGSNTLTAGSNSLSTEVSGVIADGGFFGGTGGALVKVGSGTLILSGDNTYTGGTTINGGTLQLGNGGTNGSIVGDITNNAALVVNRSNTVTLAGVISGTGSLSQIGPGTTTLTGTSTYSGATSVTAGGLIVNGSIAPSSGLTINPGALVGGTGILPATTIDGGTLSPGNSIGTITVQGNLVLSTAATYIAEISPTAGDRTNVTGTATLGGMAQVLAGPGSYAPGTPYTILNATGGISGTFSGLTTNLGSSAFLTPALSYDANNVFFSLAQTATFASVGQTRNQVATGAAVDSLDFGNPIFDAVVVSTAEGARQAFDALSGEVHASVPGVLVEDSRYLRNAVLGRLRQAPFDSGVGPMAALGIGGPALAYQQPVYAADLPVKASPAPPPARALTFWAWGFGAWGTMGGDGNAATLDRRLGGAIVGVDGRLVDGWRLGFAAGYSQSKIRVDARASSATVDSAHAAIYGSKSFGAFNLRGGAAYAHHQIDTTRSIVFPGFFDRAAADYEGHTGQVFGEIGYGFALGTVAVEPFAGFAWVQVKTDGFTEAGGAAALAGLSNTEEVGYSTLGARFATTFALANGMVLAPRLSAAWQHAFDDVTPAAALSFASGSIGFGAGGVPLAQDSALVEAGLDLRINPRATLGISYLGQFASAVEDHAVQAKFVWNF